MDDVTKEIRQMLLGNLVSNGKYLEVSPNIMQGLRYGPVDGADAVLVMGINKTTKYYEVEVPPNKVKELGHKALMATGRKVVLHSNPDAEVALCRYMVTRPIVVLIEMDDIGLKVETYTARGVSGLISDAWIRKQFLKKMSIDLTEISPEIWKGKLKIKEAELRAEAEKIKEAEKKKEEDKKKAAEEAHSREKKKHQKEEKEEMSDEDIARAIALSKERAKQRGKLPVDSPETAEALEAENSVEDFAEDTVVKESWEDSEEALERKIHEMSDAENAKIEAVRKKVEEMQAENLRLAEEELRFAAEERARILAAREARLKAEEEQRIALEDARILAEAKARREARAQKMGISPEALKEAETAGIAIKGTKDTALFAQDDSRALENSSAETKTKNNRKETEKSIGSDKADEGEKARSRGPKNGSAKAAEESLATMADSIKSGEATVEDAVTEAKAMMEAQAENASSKKKSTRTQKVEEKPAPAVKVQKTEGRVEEDSETVTETEVTETTGESDYDGSEEIVETIVIKRKKKKGSGSSNDVPERVALNWKQDQANKAAEERKLARQVRKITQDHTHKKRP